MSKIIKDDTKIRVRSGVDMTNLNLSAQEGFLLSRIAGELQVKELYQISLLDKASTATIIKKLVDQGVIEIKGKQQQEKPKKEDLKADIVPKRNYKGFIFNLVELQEDNDLPVEFRKEILFTFGNLANFNLYELLNIPDTAKAPEVKKAFIQLSRIYHPDNYFRKEIGSYSQKIKKVYNTISQAQNTLLDPVERAEYRRELIEKGSIEAQPDDILESPDERKRRLERELRRSRLKRNPMTWRVDKAKEFYEAALDDMKQQRWVSAANNFKLAISYDPNNELYIAHLEKVKDQAEMVQADKYFQRGLTLESYGQEGYFEAYLKAAELFPKGGEFNIKVARLYCDQADWALAHPYAKKAVVAEPKNIEYRLLFGKILLKLRERKEAVKQFEAALQIDPENISAKGQLKEAKKWF